MSHIKPVKATNAYEWFQAACAFIAAHRFEYYQDAFKATRGGGKTSDCLPHELDVEANVCGTAYCRAGVLVCLHDGEKPRRTGYGFRWDARVEEILGLHEPETDGPVNDLDMERWDVESDLRDLFESGMVDGTPGTAAYAREGVSGMRQFMRTHRKFLKARKLATVSQR